MDYPVGCGPKGGGRLKACIMGFGTQSLVAKAHSHHEKIQQRALGILHPLHLHSHELVLTSTPRANKYAHTCHSI